jgi:CheY-like chemotaxis protein
MVDAAELIASGDITPDQCQVYAVILLRESHRLTAMVKSSVSMQSLETGQRDLDLVPADVGSLIRRAVLAAGEDDGRPIVMMVADSLPLVAVDPEAILEVLANFLSNARGFSPAGGQITVAARPEGDMLEVSISDQGVGIVADKVRKLFQKFYRADPRMRPGLGLGLAINERLVEAHGGRIDVESHGAGMGSRFAFTLPVARLDLNPQVLIVEDDPAFARLMKAEFGALGLTTMRAADAESAQRILAALTPGAILLDLGLPGIQGEEFLGQVAAGPRKGIPIVVLSVKDLGSAETSALEAAGAMAVLPKGAGAPQAAVTLITERLAVVSGT